MTVSLGYENEPPPAEPDFNLTDDIVQVFSTPQGERVLLHLREICHFVRPTMDSRDPFRNAQNEGKRLVYLEIQSHLQHDDNELIARYAHKGVPT